MKYLTLIEDGRATRFICKKCKSIKAKETSDRKRISQNREEKNVYNRRKKIYKTKKYLKIARELHNEYGRNWSAKHKERIHQYYLTHKAKKEIKEIIQE